MGKVMEEVKVDRERIVDMPVVEYIDEDSFNREPRRYANSMISKVDEDYLPSSITNLDEISMKQVINFGTDKISPYTGRSTYGNIVESYMMSGAIPREWLEKRFKKRIDRNSKDDINMVDYEYDQDYYNDIAVKAYANWNKNKLSAVYDEWKKVKYGGMTPEEMIKDAVLGIMANSTSNKDRLEAVKVASKVFGIEKNAKGTIINVFQQGNGKEFVDAVVESTGNSNYDLLAGIDDE